MKDFFYSKEENILFQIVGYSAVDCSSIVSEMIKYLQAEGLEFAKIANVNLDEVRTFEVDGSSSRYARTRIYWCQIENCNIPENTFELDRDWTMKKWIYY